MQKAMSMEVSNNGCWHWSRSVLHMYTSHLSTGSGTFLIKVVCSDLGHIRVVETSCRYKISSICLICMKNLLINRFQCLLFHSHTAWSLVFFFFFFSFLLFFFFVWYFLPESSFLSDLDILGQQEVTSGLCLCGLRKPAAALHSDTCAVRHVSPLAPPTASDVIAAVPHLDWAAVLASHCSITHCNTASKNDRFRGRLRCQLGGRLV